MNKGKRCKKCSIRLTGANLDRSEECQRLSKELSLEGVVELGILERILESNDPLKVTPGIDKVYKVESYYKPKDELTKLGLTET